MKAAVLYGKEDVRVEHISPPKLKPGEVRVHIEAALTCGTDLKVFKRGYHVKMLVPPAVFGHEFAGVISEVRSPRHRAQGQQWRVGDHVVVANSVPCGKCFHCGDGQENLCEDLLFLNGSYAESIVIPARLVQKNMMRLKRSTAFQDAALTEPLACVVQAVEDTKLAKGQRVLIIGAGPIGLMFVVLAKKIGCHVTVAGRGGARLRMARRLRADKVVDVAGKDDLAAAVQVKVRQPFDAVIEAVGKPEVWEAGVKLVRKGGVINFFGGCPAGTSIQLDTTLIHYSNLTLRASFHHTPRMIRRALRIIEAGIIRAKDFVSGECLLTDLPGLFKSMAAGNHAVKTLIRVRE